MSRRRLAPARRASIALALTAAALVGFGELAQADAPTKQGWWSKWQDTVTTPVAGVGALPVTLPPPPTGEDGGLSVAHGPDGVQAVAALFFEAADGADATLYLRAARTAGNDKSFVLPPGAGVAACAAQSPWQSKLNGPWREAPTWRSDDCSPGTIVGGGTAMFWTLPASLQDVDGNYDIVLVPTFIPPHFSSPGAAFVVQFSTPGAETIVVGDPPEPEDTTTTTTEPEPEPPPEETTTTTTMIEPIVEESDPLVVTDIPGTGPTPGMPVVTTALSLPPQRDATTLVGFEPPRPRLPGIPDSRLERIMAVSVLFFMALALWWLGGNPDRMPRLIGALAGESRAPSPPPTPLRGVGRVARPRHGGRSARL
jgi:hypothetical protein